MRGPRWSWRTWAAAGAAAALLIAVAWLFFTTRVIQVLIVGTDGFNFSSKADSRHADTMLLVTFRPSLRRLHVLSVPRDTMVEGSKKGVMKINELFAYGWNHGGVEQGARSVLEPLSRMLQMPLRHYVVLEFRGFERAVDELGGVDVMVPKAMDYDDQAADLHIHLAQGLRRLTGREALHFVRYRADDLGDVGRIARQQQFLKAVKDRLELSRVPALARILQRHVRTNLPAAAWIRLANQVKGWREIEMTTVTLPGELWMNDKISYWKPHAKSLAALREQLLERP